MPVDLGELSPLVERSFPEAIPHDLELLTALAVTLSHALLVDRHYSAEEARKLRGALGRIETLSASHRERMAQLVEREGFELVGGRISEALDVLRRIPGPLDTDQVFDALVELAVASGSFAVASWFGVGSMERAERLGLEMPSTPVYVLIGPDAIRFDDTHLTIGTGMHEVLVPWQHLGLLEAVDPWPAVRVRWRQNGYPGDAFFRGRGDTEAFTARLEALFDHSQEQLGARAAKVIERGWLARADVDWEMVAAFPGDAPVSGSGAYRTAAASRPSEPVLARREAPSTAERLVLWLSSTPETPWAEHVLEIVVTDANLYARRRDGTIARLPLWSLRTRLGGRDGVYVFGRRTRLVLPQREAPCPVAQHLDRLLRERAERAAPQLLR